MALGFPGVPEGSLRLNDLPGPYFPIFLRTELEAQAMVGAR